MLDEFCSVDRKRFRVVTSHESCWRVYGIFLKILFFWYGDAFEFIHVDPFVLFSLWDCAIDQWNHEKHKEMRRSMSIETDILWTDHNFFLMSIKNLKHLFLLASVKLALRVFASFESLLALSRVANVNLNECKWRQWKYSKNCFVKNAAIWNSNRFFFSSFRTDWANKLWGKNCGLRRNLIYDAPTKGFFLKFTSNKQYETRSRS